MLFFRVSTSMNSGLFYHGTDLEVQLGDRVALKRWWRGPLIGTVCYIPGISPHHPELEFRDVRQWAIRLDDGSLQVMGYFPDLKLGQPSRRIVLLCRGSGGDLKPNEMLEED